MSETQCLVTQEYKDLSILQQYIIDDIKSNNDPISKNYGLIYPSVRSLNENISRPRNSIEENKLPIVKKKI